MNNFFEKRDLKALTTLSLYSSIKESNKDLESGHENQIIFITSFGQVSAEKILPRKFDDEKVTKDNRHKFIAQSSITNRDELIQENKNDDILETQTSFTLENVKIIPFNGMGTTTLPTMILFSDEIVGLTFGYYDESKN